MIYIKNFLICFSVTFLLGCQVTGGLHSGNFSKEVNSLSSYCSNIESCKSEVAKRLDFIGRYKNSNLSKYEQYQLSKVISDLDELKFEKMAFPKYCSSVNDCSSKIQIAENIIKNISDPIANQYPGMREINLKFMNSELDGLRKSKRRFTDDDIQQRKPGVRIGMTAKQVVENTSWGKPNKVNKTTNRHGTREQWVYGGGNYLYFENGILTSIQN